MTKNDRQLLRDTVAYLRVTMARYRTLADILAEPRHLTLEANAYEVLVRSTREQQDERDVREVLAVAQAIDAIDRAQCS